MRKGERYLTGVVYLLYVLWQGVGWIFSRFIATSTQYTAIYSGLAIVILLMIWVYIAWLIVLVGASVAFYHQNPEYLNGC